MTTISSESQRLPLHAWITARGATPTRWIVFLHGILGMGANWRTFARRLVDARPEYGAFLLDLRNHGKDGRGFTPPHTLAACAGDIARFAASEWVEEQGRTVCGVLGHSFGGKVALTYLRDHGAQLEHTWVIDAMPGARMRPEGVAATERVFEVLRGERASVYPSRNAFLEAMRGHGLSAGIAEWLAMNVVRVEGRGYEFGLDLDAIEQMLRDYVAQDLWPTVESPPGRGQVHVVIGGASDAFASEDIAQLDRAVERNAGRVSKHVIDGAGHWVHVDAPDALFEIVSAQLAE